MHCVEYMVNKLAIEKSKVPEMCAQLYSDYGTTMAGLRALGYDFDHDDYHRYLIFPFPFVTEASKPDGIVILVIGSFVHGRLPYEYLKPDPVLKNLMDSLPLRKVVSFISLLNQ